MSTEKISDFYNFYFPSYATGCNYAAGGWAVMLYSAHQFKKYFDFKRVGSNPKNYLRIKTNMRCLEDAWGLWFDTTYQGEYNRGLAFSPTGVGQLFDTFESLKENVLDKHNFKLYVHNNKLKTVVCKLTPDPLYTSFNRHLPVDGEYYIAYYANGTCAMFLYYNYRLMNEYIDLVERGLVDQSKKYHSFEPGFYHIVKSGGLQFVYENTLKNVVKIHKVGLREKHIRVGEVFVFDIGGEKR